MNTNGAAGPSPREITPDEEVAGYFSAAFRKYLKPDPNALPKYLAPGDPEKDLADGIRVLRDLIVKDVLAALGKR